ncbi:MAG TPA: hypothetical protein DIC18_02780 [Clostridiales bacterium]|nr:hypothetical protein [Clostridiales bacterium]
MKKVILLILVAVLIALPITLTACSSVSQRSMLMSALVCSEEGSETFIYNVHLPKVNAETKQNDYGDPIGTLTMKFEHLSKKSVVLPSETAESKSVSYGNVNYDLLTTTLTFTDSADTIESYCVYNTIGLSPVYSYKRTFIDGVEKIMQVNYGNGKYLHALRFENGVKVNDYRHERSGCYDNEEIYALIRASKISSSSYSLSFTMVSALLGSETDIQIGKKGSYTPSIGYALAEKEKCLVFSIGTGNSYASSYELAIAEHPIAVTVGEKVYNVKKVLHTIVEGKYAYVLKTIDIE